MAAAQATNLLESLFNHIALPPRLPGRQDSRIDRVERALIERLLDATIKLAHLPDNEFTSEWESLRRSLETCKQVNAGGMLTKISLLRALQAMQGRDFIALHITEQNAALIIRLDDSGQSVVFEAFEVSPQSEEVLASKTALRWDFPGSAVTVPFSEYEKSSFQEELATFLEKASTESIKRFAAHTSKASSFAFESRKTADPSLITQMLMTLLEANGRRICPPVLQKRVRDDVHWGEGGEKPWRRCPFWLMLRVVVHRHLSIMLGGDLGRIQYKFLICATLSRFLDECLGQADLDHAVFLKTKLCRRLVKLEADQDVVPAKIFEHYQYWFKTLGPELRKSTHNATKKINNAWEGWKHQTQRPVHNLPKYADPRHLTLSLYNSRNYIQRVLREPLHRLSEYSAPPVAPTMFKLPSDYDSSSKNPKSVTVFANRYFKLSEIEAKFENRDIYLNIPATISDDICSNRCIQLARHIVDYLKAVGDAYNGNPEQKSAMLVAIMELWVEMDAFAVKEFALLKDYNPGIPSDIMNVLQIPRLKDMRRVQRIREYLQRRHMACKDSKLTIFSDPGKDCFGEKYYNDSDDSPRLKTVHRSIEADALRARDAKEREWQAKTLQFEKLVQEASEATCLFTTDEYQIKTHDDRHCSKCYLNRKVRRFTMVAHESPLPEDPVIAKTVVFELICPEAFAAYRDCTWQIITTLGFSMIEAASREPWVFLGEYSELQRYVRSRSSSFSLASTTKSFLITHYAHPRFPVRLEDICLPNGLKLGYFDSRSKVWTSRLSQTQKATFAHHCQFTMPSTSPFSSLNFSADFAVGSQGPSSYAVIASQSKCPAGLNVHEYMSFQTLFSGKSRRWPQILIELGSSNVNFSTESSAVLFSMLALQLGPEHGGGALGAVHGIFRDTAFCKRLVAQLNQRLDSISSNWRETNCMETLITIADRLLELASSVTADAIKLLEKAREITSRWITILRSEIQMTTVAETSRRCSTYAFWASLLCRRTFAMYREQTRLGPVVLQSYIECSISLQDNMVNNPTTLSLALKNALIRDFKLVHQMRLTLKRSLESSQDSMISAITTIWPGAGGEDSRTFSRFEFLPDPNQWWVQVILDATSQTRQQTLLFHLLEGHLLVEGEPIGKLPPEWKEAFVLQNLFGNQSLLTYPSSLHGMTYMLAIAPNSHEIHLGFRNRELIVRARVRGAILELIPPQVFGTADHFDLPASLVEGCVHWLDIGSHIMEIRQQPSIWKSKPSNWLLDMRKCQAKRRASTLLVDPHSPLFKRIAATFLYFEYSRNLTAYQPSQGKLTVELRRLELQFYVNGNNHFESPQLKSEIDPNQDAGTWYGLKSKLVLREVVKVRDPFNNYTSTVPQRTRSILVPMGEIKYTRHSHHISLLAENNGDYAKFTINDVIGRLDCPAEPRLLYLKAMYHAYTSFVLPDSLTGRTGTEEALHCLRSGYCQPWDPITLGPYNGLYLIAKLTPRREYYPTDLKAMQKTFWDPDLTTVIQHDGYFTIVSDIMRKSSQLSMFSLQKIHLPPLEPIGETHLVLRSRLRRESYQRQSADSEGLDPADDELYTARDRWRLSQSRTNVVECTSLIRTWPLMLPTTRDLAGMLQNWPAIGTFNRCFGKVLLTDLLDVDWGTEWGSLVNFCRDCSPKDAHRLMFLFGILSFGQEADMDVLRTLIAFAVLQDLKTPSPPQHSSYNYFRLNQVPRTDQLVQLMKPYLMPYKGDARSAFEGNLKSKQRRKFESAEIAHEQQQENDSKVLAGLLLEKWPCAQPGVEGLDSSRPLLIDIELALQVIRPEWLRLFQNLELSTYVIQVQCILNSHHVDFCSPETPPMLAIEELDVFKHYPRACTIPTLQTLLSKAMLMGPSKLIASDGLRSVRTLKSPPSHTSKQSDTTTISNVNLPNGRTQKPDRVLSLEIQQLQTIADNVASSQSLVRQQYGRDLFQSLKALQKFRSELQEQTIIPITVSKLKDDISVAQDNIRGQLQLFEQSLDQVTSAHWLREGGLWPSIRSTTLLENLRSISLCEFGSGVKDFLIFYAEGITGLQRLLRLEDAFQKNNKQRMVEEQENLGHSNWKPLNHPDWLLLEIDSNMLIRPGQVEVTLATVSPQSGSNSVLQMNMGQGKTSCIMPMAAALLANGSSLVRVVVPKALLMQTAQLLHARLGGLLGREIRHVPFSRKTPTTSATIESFFKIHKDIQRSSGIVLALPDHLLSFMLSGQQRLSDGRLLEASSMIKVQKWLGSHARDVLDECDNILAMRTQLIYPSGSQKTVDGHPHRWEVAETLLGRVDGHLHNLHKAFPQSIEVIRREKGGFPVVFFLRKDVEDELLSRLIDDIYRGRLSILPECSRSDRLSIKKFISEPKVTSQVANSISKMFTDKSAIKQTIYLLRGLFVHRILLMALKKRWNVQYGLHPTRDPIAVPYHAKGTPSDQAEWGHPDVAILFTCLAFYYDGLNLAHLRQTLEHVLKSDDPSQVYDRISQNSSLPDSLREWNVINVDDEAQLKEIWQYVRYNVIVIDYFLNNFVFPRHAKQFQIKLQASGWDIPLFSAIDIPVNGEAKSNSLTALTTGFSGTNDWKGMLPLTICQHDLPGLSHTNAEVLTYLLQPRNKNYILAADPYGRHISEYELLLKINREQIRVLIDAGAQILEMNNFSLVKTWLEIDTEAPAAIFFDKNNKPMVLYQKGHQIPLLASPFAEDLGNCLVYLDEAHTRGTDLKMPTSARGALTLGLGQTKDHTVQAAMRLRKLGTTQSITFFAPPEVHQSILDLRQKKSGASLDSCDVISWLLEQTCSGIEQLQPLYYAQGADFCRRAQAALDNPEHVADAQQREIYLKSLRQIEQQTLEQLYSYTTKIKSSTNSAMMSPRLAAFTKELHVRRRAFQDAGIAVHGSALQEVEQEREVAYEVEAVREVQKPVHYNALVFPGLHRDIISFAKTGRLAADSAAYQLAFSALGRTVVGRKYGISGEATSGKLYVSTEFTRTVNFPLGRPHDQFQRQVNWVLWSNVTGVGLIVMPEEAEHLLPLVREPATTPTHILTYAAPVTRKMLHFNHLRYYAVPSLPSNWEAPLWLRIELGVFAGLLYFEYAEYNSLLEFLGVRDKAGKIKEDEIDELAGPAGATEEVQDELTSATDSVSHTTSSTKAAFTHKPLAFLQEWLAVRRKGQDFAHTPMGFLCQGKQLLENHPFFLIPGSDRVKKEVQFRKSATTANNEESDTDSAGDDENVYGSDAGEDHDDFNDDELQDVVEDSRNGHDEDYYDSDDEDEDEDESSDSGFGLWD